MFFFLAYEWAACLHLNIVLRRRLRSPWQCAPEPFDKLRTAPVEGLPSRATTKLSPHRIAI